MRPVLDFERDCFKQQQVEMAAHKSAHAQWEERHAELLDKAKADPAAKERFKDDVAALGPERNRAKA